MVSTLLAHQGGWDEVLLVASPIVVFGVLLTIANRRQAPEPPSDETAPGASGSHRTGRPGEHDDTPGTRDRS
ncbi:MAG TPA: hypothetical protein VFZ68_12060 [Acidimicrobiales bacterium]